MVKFYGGFVKITIIEFLKMFKKNMEYILFVDDFRILIILFGKL